MRPSPQEANAGSAFDTSDVNQDGFIDKQDMYLVGLHLADRLGLPPDAPARGRLQDAYAQVWENVVAAVGTDEEGRISRERYVEYAVSPRLDRTAFIVAIVWPITDALWDALDTDGDQKLSMREYLHLWSAYDVGTAEAREAFILLDTDGDGHLGKDEFAQAMYDFYFSEDPEKAAIPILGRSS
ncbi:EF-hand domain-containing protein [Sphaerisporangium album]|uniref:EF-hand domain-containing protein n=1 Tax=Sphaerisporangium album TaxID=509200 RepID=A0A367F3Q7_9ACTN|nr:EF-hand domain-containing protein [Sphaerisporangium album]RCG25008.1 EF-hand domain-containing protein [Sphaerisporangium album]